MAELYRKSSLEKISSPEQLDKALVVTSPLSWLVLIGITLIVVVTIVWSIVGTIPITVTAKGIIASPASTNAVYASESGVVAAVLVRTGSEVHLGDPILSFQDGNNEMKTIFSDQVGTVANVLVAAGDKITQGSEVIRVSPAVTGEQVAVGYVPLSDSKKIERGMRAQVRLDAINSQTHGYMIARVVNIDAYAATTTGMGYVLGSDNNLAASFQNSGAVVAITCEFYPAETLSGYYWSNQKGATVNVASGSSATIKIITEEVAPITKLFSKLKEIWGD